MNDVSTSVNRQSHIFQLPKLKRACFISIPNRMNGGASLGITKRDLHSLVDTMPTNERALEKAYRLLSSVKEDVTTSVTPLPLPPSGLSYDAYIEFLNSHQLSSKDAEELESQLDEFDRIDNLTSSQKGLDTWES